MRKNYNHVQKIKERVNTKEIKAETRKIKPESKAENLHPRNKLIKKRNDDKKHKEKPNPSKKHQ